jgi:hypothetical protein
VEKTPGSGSRSEKRSEREVKWKFRALRTAKNGGRTCPESVVIQRKQRPAEEDEGAMEEQTLEWREARQN